MLGLNAKQWTKFLSNPSYCQQYTYITALQIKFQLSKIPRPTSWDMSFAPEKFKTRSQSPPRRHSQSTPRRSMRVKHSSVGISPPDTPTHNLFPRQYHCRREIWATFLDNRKLDTLSIQVKYEYTLCMFIFHLNGIPCILIFKTCTHEAINWLSTKCEFFTLYIYIYIYRYALLMLTLVTDQACSLVSCSQLGGVK